VVLVHVALAYVMAGCVSLAYVVGAHANPVGVVVYVAHAGATLANVDLVNGALAI